MPQASKTKKPAVKKAARKKATTKKKTTTVKRTSRSTSVSGSSVKRKAPTALSAKSKKDLASVKVLGFVLLGLLCVGGVSAAVGLSDNGEINVSSVIESRGSEVEVVNSDGEVETISIPKNNTVPKKKNGGLVGKGKNTTPAPAPAPEPDPVVEGATDTASSTDEASSGTESMATEEETATNEEVTDQETVTDAVEGEESGDAEASTESVITEEEVTLTE